DGLEQEFEIVADLLVDLLLRGLDGHVLTVVGLSWPLTCSTTFSISDSLTQAPWTRIGLAAPIGRNRASPWPMSFSAPGWSSTTRESASDEVANARREGTLALMRPVTTSTLGRWVASTRWMPAARASCVMSWTEASASCGATLMRSASSSTTTSRYG